MNNFKNIKIRPTLPVKFRGKPEFSKDDCVGCAACAKVCPASAICVVDDLKTRMRKLTLRLDRCLFCGNCQKNCIKETGIILSNQYDMVTPDKDEPVVSIDKELLVCDCCGSVMGAKDHLIFLAKKLGALAYGNPLLILAHQVELKLGEIGFDSKSSSKAPAGRAVIFRALCPYCRRLAMLEDEKTEQKGA